MTTTSRLPTPDSRPLLHLPSTRRHFFDSCCSFARFDAHCSTTLPLNPLPLFPLESQWLPSRHPGPQRHTSASPQPLAPSATRTSSTTQHSRRTAAAALAASTPPPRPPRRASPAVTRTTSTTTDSTATEVRVLTPGARQLSFAHLTHCPSTHLALQQNSLSSASESSSPSLLALSTRRRRRHRHRRRRPSPHHVCPSSSPTLSTGHDFPSPSLNRPSSFSSASSPATPPHAALRATASSSRR